MEKRNVMKSGVLWNQVVTATHKDGLSDVELSHMLADAGGMQLVRWPKQFDVIVTDNLFGDMLSDVAAMLTGSLGMLPSASLGAEDAKTEKAQGAVRAGARLGPGHRRPGHGQPDRHDRKLCHVPALFVQHGRAGPIVSRLRLQHVLDKGLRTGDIMSDGMPEGFDRRDGRRHPGRLRRLIRR
jgi:3-isopropylmalate dehydrogenase